MHGCIHRGWGRGYRRGVMGVQHLPKKSKNPKISAFGSASYSIETGGGQPLRERTASLFMYLTEPIL